MRSIGNFLWFVFGGLFMGLGWWLAGLVCAITIIGIPFGIQHLNLAGLALAPVGQTIVSKESAEAARVYAAQAAVAQRRG